MVLKPFLNEATATGEYCCDEGVCSIYNNIQVGGGIWWRKRKQDSSDQTTFFHRQRSNSNADVPIVGAFGGVEGSMGTPTSPTQPQECVMQHNSLVSIVKVFYNLFWLSTPD